MNALIGIGVAALGAAGLGLGGYEVYKHYHMKKLASGAATIPPGHALDAGVDQYTANVIAAALSKETDTSILDTLAANLKASGFTNSAQVIATRSQLLKSNIASSTKASTAVKGILTGLLPDAIVGCPENSTW